MYRDAIGVVAALLSIAGLSPYIRDAFRRRTRPHLFTWIIWSVMTWIAFAAQVSGGGGPGAWATGISALLCLPIVIVALFDGEKEIRPLDWMSLAAALLAGIAWAINHDPTVSVVLVSFIDAVGFVPTIRKSIHRPEQETLANYVLSGAKHALSIVALSTAHRLSIRIRRTSPTARLMEREA